MSTLRRNAEWGWLSRTLPATRWSLLARLKVSPPHSGAEADVFAKYYWFPLYSYLRHSGHSEQDAQDHVQNFLSHLLEKQLLQAADPSRGQLRDYLLTLLLRFVSSRKRGERAQKRGGNCLHISMDQAEFRRLELELASPVHSPEAIYRKAMAAELVTEGVAALTAHYEKTQRQELLNEILPALEGPLQEDSYAEVGKRLSMKTPAVRTAVMRMRERFKLCVEERAAVVLGIPHGPLLDAELRDLFC